MKTKINVNCGNANSKLGQKEFDKIMNSGNAINLSKRTTTSQRLQSIERRRKNTPRYKRMRFTSIFLPIIMLILVVSLGIKTISANEVTFEEELQRIDQLEEIEEKDMDSLIEIFDKEYNKEVEEITPENIEASDKSYREFMEEGEAIYNKKNNRIKHKEWNMSDERQEWINYAYKIGGKDFVLTILAENGSMGIDRKSYAVGANGYSDYGLCQINVGWHPEVLGGSNGKRFKDWFYNPYKQLDYCNKLFTGGTRFYGYDVRHKVEHKLEFYGK